MIPNEHQAKVLWDTYQLPHQKRVHVELVARVAMFLAKQLMRKSRQRAINTKLLNAAALLHDIDKGVPVLPGERHPDTAVRLLMQEGMEEIAALVKTHPLHAIIDTEITPSTWEEKLLYLSDKMVKYEIITVDKRFALWNDEHLPQKEQQILDACYPKVKELEKEIFRLIGIAPVDVAKLA